MDEMTKASAVPYRPEHRGFDAVRFSGEADALFERHLRFDSVVDPAVAARATSSRPSPMRCATSLATLDPDRADLRARKPEAGLLPLDGVPDRPVAGQQHHQPDARSDRRATPCARRRTSTGWDCWSRSRTRGWATAGLGGWRPASWIPWPPCNSRPWATACATNTASSDRRSRTVGKPSSPTTGCAARIRGKSHARMRRWRVKLDCSFEISRRRLQLIPGRPSSLIGIPYRSARGGLRRQDRQHTASLVAAAPDYFDFQGFSSGDFVGAVVGRHSRRIADARALSRRLDRHGPGPALRAGVFPGRLLAGRSRAPLPPRQYRLEQRFPKRWPSSSTTRIRRWRCPS